MTREEAWAAAPGGPASYWLEIGTCVACASSFFYLLKHAKHHEMLFPSIGVIILCLSIVAIAHASERLFFPIHAAQRTASFSPGTSHAIITIARCTQFAGLAMVFTRYLSPPLSQSGLNLLGWLLYIYAHYLADFGGAKLFQAKPSASPPKTNFRNFPPIHSDHWGER
jgi:hypothetical protein